MGASVVGGHCQCVAAHGHRLVVAAGDAEFIEVFIEMDAVILRRAMADGVNRYCRSTIFIGATNHASIGMLVALQDEVYAILTHQVVEHPALDSVVLALDGIERMVKQQDFPLGCALFQLLL